MIIWKTRLRWTAAVNFNFVLLIILELMLMGRVLVFDNNFAKELDK